MTVTVTRNLEYQENIFFSVNMHIISEVKLFNANPYLKLKGTKDTSTERDKGVSGELNTNSFKFNCNQCRCEGINVIFTLPNIQVKEVQNTGYPRSSTSTIVVVI